MPTFWVNNYNFGRSVMSVIAESESGALEFALEDSPLDSNGLFHGQYREFYRASPLFVTGEQPATPRSTQAAIVLIEYAPRQGNEEWWFHVHQDFIYLEMCPIEANSVEQALAIYERTMAAIDANPKPVEMPGDDKCIYVSQLYVTLASETMEGEDEFFERAATSRARPGNT